MPPLPPLADVVRWKFIGVVDGRLVINVLHSEFTGGGGVIPDLTASCHDAFTAFGSHVVAHVNAGYTLEQVTAEDLTSNTAPVAQYTGSTAGGGGGTLDPLNTALVLSWPIARRYRGGHPRTYIVGLESDQRTDARFWSPATITTFAAAGAAFRTAMDAISNGSYSTFTLGVASYRTGNAPRVTPIFTAFIGDPQVHPRVDSQRRRLGKEAF
jgi:hypothetical protein